MIKRTLYFGNPAYLSKKDSQLKVKKPDEEDESSIPIEDIGIVIIDNPQVTLTHGVLTSLLSNNSAVITCDKRHMPQGMLLNLDSGHIQSEMYAEQINTSEPLKKQLWQQTIKAKIFNQASLLKRKGIPITNMLHWTKKVRSGDPDNYEGRAAAYYWNNLFPKMLEFKRDKDGEAPNQLLNYGYAILRAITARALAASSLLSTLGIHHSNKYNAYCLADDIMEPYRPFVDNIVYTIVRNGEDFYELSTSIKKQLLEIATVDVEIDNKKSPLMIGMQRTTASLAKCFSGELRKINYPVFPN